MIKLFLLLSSYLVVSNMYAQKDKLAFGIGSGINIANLRYTPPTRQFSPSTRIGFNGYIFCNARIAKQFSIQTEIGYYSLGSYTDNKKYGYTFPNETTEINYLTASVLPRIKIKKTGLSFIIGPSFALKLNSEAILKNNFDPNGGNGGYYFYNDYKSIDVFGIVGAEYFIQKGLGLSAKYMHGLTNILGVSYPGAGTYNHAFTFSLAYRFMCK